MFDHSSTAKRKKICKSFVDKKDKMMKYTYLEQCALLLA
jgi:hypothetical protein